MMRPVFWDHPLKLIHAGVGEFRGLQGNARIKEKKPEQASKDLGGTPYLF